MKTTKPQKQRKQLLQDPLHRRYKRFSAPLSPELKKAHNTASIPVRTGDTVKLMRGERKGFEGKVSQVNRTKYRIFVEGVTREKVDGTAFQFPIHPSKVMITHLNLDDKWRRTMSERKGAEKKGVAPEEKIEKMATEKEPKPAEKEVTNKTPRKVAKKTKTPEKTKKTGGKQIG